MPKRPVVDRGTYEFPSLPPATALYFSVLEQSGCRRLLEKGLKALESERRASGAKVPLRNLTADMALKAISGTNFTNGQRYPLYEVSAFYSSSPTDIIFGAHVRPRSLSDTVLAERMEELVDLDMDAVMRGIAGKVNAFFGLSSDDLYLDQTDVDYYGVDREDRTGKATHMRLSGKCKSGRTKLLHKEISVVCDGNGVVMYTRPFDGATSDTEMDLEAVESIIDHLDRRSVVSGDCKFCDFRILKTLDERKVCFVTKVPDSFSDNLRDTIVESARSGQMDGSAAYPGRLMYETHSPISNSDGEVYGDMRLIAYVLPGGKDRARRYLEGKGLKDFRKALMEVWHRRFDTKEQAVEAVLEAMDEAEAPIYQAVVTYSKDPRKDNRWMVRVESVGIDRDLLNEAAEKYAVQVLITNARLSDTDSELPMEGRTSDNIVNRYLSQAVVEKRFRQMKTCHGVGHVFVHTPIRQDALIFIEGVTASVHSGIDAALKARKKKGERSITMEMLGDRLVGCRLAYDEPAGRIFFSGDEKSKELFFEAVDRLGVDLGYAFFCG